MGTSGLKRGVLVCISAPVVTNRHTNARKRLCCVLVLLPVPPPHSIPTAFLLIVLSTPLALCSSIHKHGKTCHWPDHPIPPHRVCDGTLQSLSASTTLPVSLGLSSTPSASPSLCHTCSLFHLYCSPLLPS